MMYRADLITQFCDVRDLTALAGTCARLRATLGIARVIDALRAALSGAGMEYLTRALAYQQTHRGAMKCCMLPIRNSRVTMKDIAKRVCAQFARCQIERIDEMIARMCTTWSARRKVEICAMFGYVFAGNFDESFIRSHRLDIRSVIATCTSLIVRGTYTPRHIAFINDICPRDRFTRRFTTERFAECLATIADGPGMAARTFTSRIYSARIDAREVFPLSRRVIEIFVHGNALTRHLARCNVIVNDIDMDYFARKRFYHRHILASMPASDDYFPSAYNLMWRDHLYRVNTQQKLAYIMSVARNPDGAAIVLVYNALWHETDKSCAIHWCVDIPWIISMGIN